MNKIKFSQTVNNKSLFGLKNLEELESRLICYQFVYQFYFYVAVIGQVT